MLNEFLNMDDCIFCNELKIIYEDAFWKAIYDKYPVSKGHVLIISKKHFENYFDLGVNELFSLHMTIQNVKKIIDKNYHPDGYNIGCNCGEAAGQTINHFHLHIIPRYKGDIDNPKGGIRGVIPNKQNY